MDVLLKTMWEGLIRSLLTTYFQTNILNQLVTFQTYIKHLTVDRPTFIVVDVEYTDSYFIVIGTCIVCLSNGRRYVGKTIKAAN